MTDEARAVKAWATLHRAHARSMATLSRRMEAERGVSVLEHGCLYELNGAPRRRLRMAELAERVGLSPSATTRLVDRLEKRAWVSRESPPGDRRTTNVVATIDGRRAYARNNRPFIAAVRDLLHARLDDDELTLLVSLLERLTGGPTRPVGS